MADTLKDVRALQAAINKAYSCKSKHVDTVPVRELYQGELVWVGKVEVFDLVNHPQAKRCYAWGHATKATGPEVRIVTVLGVPPIDSPRKAVQVSIVADCQSTSPVVPAKPSKQAIPSDPHVPATSPSRLQPTPPSLPAVKSLFFPSWLRRLRPTSPPLPPVESLRPTQPPSPPSQSTELRSPGRLLFGKTATTHVVLVPPKSEVEIGRADVDIGWCPDVDLTPYGGTAETGVSRHHAKITRRGILMIEDMNSVNGTYLNGQRLTPRQETPLLSGDILTLGDLQFTYIA